MRTIKIRRNVFVLSDGTTHSVWQIWRLVLKGWATAENVRDDWNATDVERFYAAYGLNVVFDRTNFEDVK